MSESNLIFRQDAINAIKSMMTNLKYGKSEREALYDAQNLMCHIPSAQEWIPCSERLPEEAGRYLCTYSDFATCVDFGLYTDGQWIIEPIAWMPLPQPWKEEFGKRDEENERIC